MSHVSNVTKFPSACDEDRRMVSIDADFAKRLYYRDGWKSLAKRIMTHDVAPNMMRLAHQVATSKKRPTNRQIATLFGVMVTKQLEDVFSQWDEKTPTSSGDVVPLKRRTK